MAALDRQNPNLDDFVGLNWSCWVERVNILPSDAESNVDDSSKHVRNPPEAMTLKKEDMHTFGRCPSHDEISLVVCSHCGQVVKPQAFEKHCERRHGPLTKTCGQSSSASQQRLRPARPLANHSSSRQKQKDTRGHGASAHSSAVSPVHQHRPSKAQQEAVSFHSVETFPQEKSSLPQHSSPSMPRPRVPAWHSGPLPPGPCSSSTSPSELPPVQKPTAGQSSESHSPLRGTRTYSRTYKNINKKECDLNTQYGVLDPERKKLCSQELICNTDSIHQEQNALGRTKTVDQLTEEQKTASGGQDMEQLPVKSKDKEQHQQQHEKITLQSSKTFNSNSHVLSRSTVPSESIPVEQGGSTVEVEAQPQILFNKSLFSGEESEDIEQAEDIDLPATPWHPKPLGLCTFGCRTLGCSIFTFNRRWHHLRFALSAMLEHHVSTHLWKKMPQVSSGLRSCHVTPPTVGSPVRTARPTKSTCSLSLEPTSLGPLETKTSQHNSHSIKPMSSTTSARLIQDASAAQKAAHSGEDKSFKNIRDPLNEKGQQPHVPSNQGTVNGTISHKKKACPPLNHSPRSRGKPPGIQQKVVGYDHRGPSKKRKVSNESQPISSSRSRTKCQRLSSPSQRGERMERITGARMLWAWRKDSTPEDQ
ncbi:ataxin-7-like protein 2b isoform X2 [Cyclopterus lumpus]|uniref:ataxin-7-like protein 2b isoform X2 n=1 Tax=Cyclopterus lumpus TaxID=8103 RepID=UPI001485D93A|nr:ataxin-7-like protein 2b isoform X2 [Cyclopterus lumpus]